MQVQTQYFQVVANVTTGSPQADIDPARANLQNQVNTFLSPLDPRFVLDVTAREEAFQAGNSEYILLTAEVTYKA